MKQFSTIFKFEFFNYFKKKSFIAVTLILVIAMGVGLSFPRLMQLFDKGGSGGGSDTPAEKTKIGFSVTAGDAQQAAAWLNTFLHSEELVVDSRSEDEIRSAVESGEYESAVLMTSPLSYKRIVRDIKMMDTLEGQLDELLVQKYRMDTITSLGVSQDEAQSLLTAQTQKETIQVSGGKDQRNNFFYTYILIFLLYFAIIMYGQFVATSVATEKSSRAMELLITSARPKTLMFGKVFGAGVAGIAQFVILLGSGFLFYNLNKSYYEDNMMVQSIFNMPLSMLLYCILFFVLGFFIYAFLYGALGSLVSRMEELATTIAPITYVFVIAFMVVMFSMSSGNVDNGAMLFCSYFPLTSPMAMFTRIAMGNVAAWEIILSVIILIVSTIGIGVLAASIYRLGVLLYGKAPKPKEIVKLLRQNK